MQYRPELDGLRALAVLAVFAVHTGYNVGPGFLGVNVFFVLSGYLITSLLATERERNGHVDYKAFYMRRVLRLYPALVAACLLVGVAATWVVIESASKVVGEIGLALSYLTDFYVAIEPPSSWGRWLGQTWSLGVEEQFYLVWPFVLIWLGRGDVRTRIVALTAALATVPIVGALTLSAHAAQYSPLGAGFQLAAGATLAFVPIRVPRGTWVLAVGAYLVVARFNLDPGRSIPLQCGIVQVFTVTAVLLVAWAIQHTPRLLRLTPVVWLGKRSYGFYLYHLPLIVVIHDRIHVRSEATVLSLLAALLVSAASYRWVEQPFLRLKRRYTTAQPERGRAARA